MSDTIIAALVSSGVTLLVTMVTLVANALIERFKKKSEVQQNAYQFKREVLNGIYKTLISIINLYPNSSPNDILKAVDYAPYFSLENFEGVLKSLDYQIEDYKNQLNITNIDYNQKSNLELQISNREFAKQKISRMRDEYYMARDKYKAFCESDEALFELYAGQDVQICLINFKAIIDNAFIAGIDVGYNDDPINNAIQASKRNLINSIRNDIAIY